IDQHSRFIRLNATVKLSTELEAEGARSGALSRYLEGRLLLNGIEPSVKAEAPDALRTALSEARGSLRASSRDESIGLFFVEKAEALLTGGAGSAAESEVAAAEIVHDVLPAYRAALDGAASIPAAGGPAVTVTLVRWPYT